MTIVLRVLILQNKIAVVIVQNTSIFSCIREWLYQAEIHMQMPPKHVRFLHSDVLQVDLVFQV